MDVEGSRAVRAAKVLSRSMLAASPVLLLLPLVAGLAAMLRAVTASPRISTSAIFAVLASLGLLAFIALTRQRRPRAGVLAACHALAWAPVLAAGAWSSIDEALVSRPVRGCGTGLMAFLMVALPAGGVVLLVLGLVAGLLFIRRATDRAIRTAAFCASGLALVAFAFAVVRVARPDPDTYLASLEQVAELHASTSAQIAGRTYRYEPGTPIDPTPVRTADGKGDVLSARVDCILAGLSEPMTFYSPSTSCANLRFRVDRGHDLGVVDAPSMQYGLVVAFRPSTGETIAITPTTISDHIAPPIGWTIGAGLGGLIGAACVLAASRARRRAAAMVAREAKHTGGGMVELETGETLRVDAAAGLPLGSVVLTDHAEQLPTYRQAGTPTFGAARSGTLADLRGDLTDLAASLDAVAIAAAALGAAPLLVARLVAGL
jgi:hypothetical protein